MPPLLRVRDLSVDVATADGVARILDRVNLTIGRGEVVGLVGESGCGKTTLARAILGVLPEPQCRVGAGEILFDGVDLLTLSASEMQTAVRGRRITFIPQDPFGSLNPVFKLGTQIGDLMKWKSARGSSHRQAVLEILEEVQIQDPAGALEKYPHQFSGGQRQRLLIAMAMLPQPDLIIADEPTTALDVTIQAQVLKLLRRLVNERHISALFTTHDLGTAYEICDRIVVMYAGQDVEAAPTSVFFSRPAHHYTQKLLESLPDPKKEIRDIRGEIPSIVAAPSGCRFHPRCEAAQPDCSVARPPETDLGGRHTYHCLHPIASA